MALELTGKLLQLLPEQTGTGKVGPWTKQEFVIETQDQYPRKVCFSLWNERTGVLKSLREGDVVKVLFNAESRDYNGRWYTDLRAWKIENQGRNSESQPAQKESAGREAAEEPPAFNGTDEADDLPF